MRVLLLNPPGKKLYVRDGYCSFSSKANFYWPQGDLLIQSGILSKDHELFVLDANVRRLTPEASFRVITHIAPEAIFFVTGAVSWHEDSLFLKRIKNAFGSLMIGSGDIVQFNPYQMMSDHSFFDAILLDMTSVSLKEFLHKNDTNLENLIYKKDSHIVSGPRVRHSELFSIPIPKHDLFPLSSYRLPFFEAHRPYATTLASYGCPYTCSFCSVPEMGFKLRKIENILEEIEFLSSLGISQIYFRDPGISNSHSHLMTLCEHLLKLKHHFTWVCHSRVDTIDFTLLSMMKDAGCKCILWGVESASENILKNYKGISNPDVSSRAIHLSKSLGIENAVHIILGLPGDTEGRILKTIKFVKDLDCDYVAFNIAMPRVGTKLREQCLDSGWISPEDMAMDISSSLPAFDTPYLGRERLRSLRNHAIREFYLRPHYIFKTLKKVKGWEDIKMLMSSGLSLMKSLWE